MTAYARPLDAASLAQNFAVFAAAECEAEPLYATLSRGIAATPELLALVLDAPYRQRRPVLLFACVHDLLLSGVTHPLAAFYPSVAGTGARTDVAAAPAAFADFCRRERDALAALLATRTTQTNEIGRGAVLRAILCMHPVRRELALIDVGCSAGLNLLVDRYRFVYRCGEDAFVTGPESTVVIPANVDKPLPHPVDAPLPPLGARVGVDLAPLDVRDARDARWLRACVWPSDLARRDRLANAIAIARTTRLDLRAGDASALLPSVLASLDPALAPVVFHSWVVTYFDHASRARFANAMREMVVERDGLWISAEAAGVVPGLPPDLECADDGREATLWHCTRRGSDGRAETTLVARSHPHGRWIEWTDQAWIAR